MFTQLVALATIALSASAVPLPRRGSPKSLDSWGGYASLQGFDSFYGSDNYSGAHHEVTVVPGHDIVCHQTQINIVQQRLLVIQEYAKKIITELVCEVEVQTIVFEQFHGGLGHFSQDLTRDSDYKVGYDYKIAEHLPKLWGDDYADWGFTGQDYGKNYVAPSGNNWNDETSPKSVHEAWSTSYELKHEYKPPVVEHDKPYYPPSYDPEYPPDYYTTEYQTYPAEYAPTYEPYYESYAPEHTPVYESYAPEYTPAYESYAPEYTPAYESYTPEYTSAVYESYAPEYSYSAAPSGSSVAPKAKVTAQSDPALAPSTETASASSAASSATASAA